MNNQLSLNNILLIVTIKLFALLFGLYLISKSSIIAILYFVVIFICWKKWEKDKKIKLKAWKETRKIAHEKSLQKTREKIAKMPEWRRKGYSSPTEYLADKERRIRKREQDYFLAKSYGQRQKVSAFKKKLVTIDNLLRLNPVDFERWVKVNIFENSGWRVSETKTTGDGGIDLVLNRKNEHSIAQCKRFKKTVGEPFIRDFYGTMISEGVSKGYFITTGLFSLAAFKFAKDKPIVLMDRRVLAQKLTSR